MTKQNFVINELIGEGSFGLVYSAREKFTGAYVALKVPKVPPTSYDELVSVHEIAALRLIGRHANIVELQGVIFEPQFKALVFELVPENLLEFYTRQQSLGVEKIREITFRCAKAIYHLHSKGLVHRDIKPQNIMVDPNDLSKTKLADFGQSRSLRQDDLLTLYTGTRWYRAPELIIGCHYNFTVDVFALGCIVTQLLTGNPLLPGKNDLSMINLIIKRLVQNPSCLWPDFTKWCSQNGLETDFTCQTALKKSLLRDNSNSSLQKTAKNHQNSSLEDGEYKKNKNYVVDSATIHAPSGSKHNNSLSMKLDESSITQLLSGSNFFSKSIITTLTSLSDLQKSACSTDDAQLVDLLIKMLKVNPEQRITMDKVLLHPFFKMYASQLPSELKEAVRSQNIESSSEHIEESQSQESQISQSTSISLKSQKRDHVEPCNIDEIKAKYLFLEGSCLTNRQRVISEEYFEADLPPRVSKQHENSPQHQKNTFICAPKKKKSLSSQIGDNLLASQKRASGNSVKIGNRIVKLFPNHPKMVDNNNLSRSPSVKTHDQSIKKALSPNSRLFRKTSIYKAKNLPQLTNSSPVTLSNKNPEVVYKFNQQNDEYGIKSEKSVLMDSQRSAYAKSRSKLFHKELSTASSHRGQELKRIRENEGSVERQQGGKGIISKQYSPSKAIPYASLEKVSAQIKSNSCQQLRLRIVGPPNSKQKEGKKTNASDYYGAANIEHTQIVCSQLKCHQNEYSSSLIKLNLQSASRDVSYQEHSKANKSNSRTETRKGIASWMKSPSHVSKINNVLRSPQLIRARAQVYPPLRTVQFIGSKKQTGSISSTQLRSSALERLMKP